MIKKKFALRFPRWASNLSEPAKDLLTKLLDVDPKTRITAEDALKHPWVSGKSAAPNNYLQSPNMLGGRMKREASIASPVAPDMNTMHNKLLQANSECAKANENAAKVKAVKSKVSFFIMWITSNVIAKLSYAARLFVLPHAQNDSRKKDVDFGQASYGATDHFSKAQTRKNRL